jgi:hypothetical protein
MAALGPDAPPAEHYVRESVGLRAPKGHPDDFELVRDGRVVTESEFRHLYDDVARTGDLDAILKKRAGQKVPLVAAAGLGFVVVGGGGVALMALPSSGCGKNPGCAKGVVSALLLAGSGAYMLGCVAVKGSRCILDGNVGVKSAGLRRDEAAHFVARYDAALAKKLGWAEEGDAAR